MKSQRHCWEMSQLLTQLWEHDPSTVTNKDGVAFEYPDAAEWLDLAAGVERVEIVTGFFDEGLYLCENALDYENARSDCMSRIAAQLTIFTFVWGAFEILGRIINPVPIPKQLRPNGEDSLVDRLIYFIQSTPPHNGYENAFTVLERAVAKNERYSRFLRHPPLPMFMGAGGRGIDLVRRIRNQFAHGAARFPMPDDWGEDVRPRLTTDQVMIAYSTEVTLFTMGMLLEEHLKSANFVIRGPGGVEEELRNVLRNLGKNTEEI